MDDKTNTAEQESRWSQGDFIGQSAAIASAGKRDPSVQTVW